MEHDPPLSPTAVGAGARIAALRKIADITQERLAALLHVTQSTIAKWETGERMADPDRMTTICSRFKVTMDFLYRGRLEGVPRDLALVLAQRHPELVVVPTLDMGDHTDTDQP